MRRVGGRRREHQFAIGCDFNVASTGAAIRDRHAADLGVVLGRYHDLQGGRDHAVGTNDLRPVLGEGHRVAVGLNAAGLITRGPHGAALDVSQKQIAAAVVARGVFAPTRHAQIAPAAIAGAGTREHDRIAAVREQVRLRLSVVRREQPSYLGKLRLIDARCRVEGLGARGHDGYISRRALLQQQLGRADARLGMKSRAHPAVEQDIGDRDHRHALVVRHEGSDQRESRPFRHAAARVVERLMKTIAPACAERRQPRKVPCRALRIDHRRQRGGVRGNDGVFAQAALDPQARHAEIRILISGLEIARVVGRFRNAPGHTEFRAVTDLPLHDQAIGLLQQAPAWCAHDQ